MADKPLLYILDDEPQYVSLLMDAIDGEGWETVAEQSPRRFLTYELPKSFVLILDLNMPEMDGIEVIRALSEKDLDVRLILISGFDARVLHSAQQLAEAHNIKVINNFTKPVPILELLRMLEDVKMTMELDSVPRPYQYQPTVTELQHAIEHNHLVLHYQPQVDITSGKVQGVEALVRWNHPVHGMIFPDQFIEMAEENNLIMLLTKEVLEMSFKQEQAWRAQGLELKISINISAQSVNSLLLPEQLKKLTDIYDVKPERVILEITESGVMKELTSSLDVLNRLRMKGFSLSIDDFGTGYSSLTKLYQAPFSELKIDKSFIMQMMKDKEAEAIVKICIMLGHMLGMKLVAEGVEDKEIYENLKTLECDIAQGYYVAKPMPGDDLLLWCQNNQGVFS